MGASFKKWQVIAGILAGICGSYYYSNFGKQSAGQILVLGCKNFSASAVQEILSLHLSQNRLNLPQVKQMIKDLDFVEKCHISQTPLGQIIVELYQKKLLARNINHDLIAEDGSVIKTALLFKPALPKIAGNGHEAELPEFLAALKAVDLSPELSIFIRPGRWDIVLDGKLIRLPEYKAAQGLQSLRKLSKDVLDSAQEIDLRKPGYAILLNDVHAPEQWLEEITSKPSKLTV